MTRKMNVEKYARGVEKLVDPIMVGKAHYSQTKFKKLPVFLQRKIIKSATKKATKMPFIVEPSCRTISSRRFRLSLVATAKSIMVSYRCFEFTPVCFGVRERSFI